MKTIEGSWFNTHDIGYKNEKGYLYILCRTDDMIIKVGMNIDPKEIENAINSLPEISECMVYTEKRHFRRKYRSYIELCVIGM